jgi:hypothetical protein
MYEPGRSNYFPVIYNLSMNYQLLQINFIRNVSLYIFGNNFSIPDNI